MGGGMGRGGGMSPGGMGGMGAPPAGGGGKKKPRKNPNEPETHAASGASDDVIAVRRRAVTTGKAARGPEERSPNASGATPRSTEPEIGRGPETSRHFYGLWYDEESDKYRFRTLFPLWLERTQPSLTDPTKTDRASLFGGIYYNRRSAEHADDILFPLIWNLSDETSRARRSSARS